MMFWTRAIVFKVSLVLLTLELLGFLTFMFFNSTSEFYYSSNLGVRFTSGQGRSDFQYLCQQQIFREQPRFNQKDLQSLPILKIIDTKLNDSEQNDKDQLQYIQKHLRSLPIELSNMNKSLEYQTGNCGRYPDIFDIEYDNLYWQSLFTSRGVFKLFSAYYDVRNLSGGPSVRIIAMIDRVKPSFQTYCQLWLENELDPVIVTTLEYTYIWSESRGKFKQGTLQPYLITCRIPKKLHNKIPASVSLVENPCDNATNNIRIIYKIPENGVKKGFGVCVKGLDFLHKDISVRLIEWIELLKILGADKIFFYKFHVHPNVLNVLSFYEEKGLIEVTPVTLPGGQPNLPILQHLYLKRKTANKRQNELIPYNDCLYKNLYSYEYLTLLDIDEVIMPIKALNWAELMSNIVPRSLKDNNEKIASYVFQNVYFFDGSSKKARFNDIPEYHHMLQHVHRAVNFTKPNEYVKCFHDPEMVLILHNHFPLACFDKACSRYTVDNTEGRLQHYRADCVAELKATCQSFKENSLFDPTIFRYKSLLINATSDTLHKLGFLKRSEDFPI